MSFFLTTKKRAKLNCCWYRECKTNFNFFRKKTLLMIAQEELRYTLGCKIGPKQHTQRFSCLDCDYSAQSVAWSENTFRLIAALHTAQVLSED